MNKLKIILIVFLLSFSFFISVSIAVPTHAYDDDWPMYRHDLQRSGSSNATASNGRLLWQYPTGYQVRSSPAVVNGVVYIGSLDGYVYALNAATGSKIWQYTAHSGVDSSPAVADGVVYVASLLANLSNGYVYALNATNGAKIWQFTTNSGIESSPVVVGGVVYIGSSMGYVYALNATNGSPIWSFLTGDSVYSSPAVVNNTIYVGSGDHYVYALNASNGAKIWSFLTGDNISSSPAVVGGVVYIGSRDGNVYALKAIDGSKIWHYTTGGYVYSSPVVAGGVVYVSSGDHYVYALNAATGAQIWSYRASPSVGIGYVHSSPAVGNGIVYVGSGDWHVYALNAATGAQIWSYRTGDYVFSSPAVVGGVVYIGSFDGNVYALGAISLSPTSGIVGSIATFRVSGLLGSRLVTATFDNSPLTLNNSLTDSSGSLTATFTVPASSFGNHTFTVTDGWNTAAASFWTTPTISLNSTSGNVGSLVTVTGTGLVGSRAVTATFGNTVVSLSNSLTSSSGGLSATFTVPASTAGNQPFQLSDGNNSLTTTYTVTPSISLTPNSGRVNSSATLTGSGFAGSSTIKATFDGLSVSLNGTVITNAFGSFSTTFTIPASTAGVKSVVVTDQSSNSASNLYNVTSVIQPVTVTVSGSASPATVTVTGGNPSPATFLANGNQCSIILDQGATFTLSFSNSGNTRYGFNVSNTFSATSAVYPASTTPLSVTAYGQLNNTFSVLGVSGTDAVDLKGTYLGIASSIITTLNASNSWRASAWSDYGTAVTFPTSTIGSGSNERWSIGEAYSTPTLTTGGNNSSKQYYHQYQQILSYVVIGGGSPSAPTASGLAFGATYAPTLAAVPAAYWFDSSGSITFSTSAGNFGERWIPNPASVSVTSFGAQVVNMHHQYQVTFTQANLSSDALGTVVTVNGVGKTYAELPFSLWVDAPGLVTFSYATEVPSGAYGKQYVIAGTDYASPLLITSSTTVTCSYKPQFQVIFANSGLASDAIGANSTSGTSGLQWVDSGASLAFNHIEVVSSSIAGKQYVLSSVNATSPLTVTAPITIIASYTTQYRVSFDVNPIGVGTTTPSGTNLWVDAGDLPISAIANMGYAFSSWTTMGPITFASSSLNSTTATVNGTGTITANFATAVIPYATMTITATTSDASTVHIITNGNVTAQQMSNVFITPNHSSATTTVSFSITGIGGTVGFSNMTIPKSAIPYGTNPVLYIDGQQASNQGYTQDDANFYVWYTTQFSTREITIEFTTVATPSPTPTPEVSTTPLIIIVALAAVVLVILISIAIAIKRKPHK